MLGTIVNTITIVTGSLIGSIVRKGIKEKYQELKVPGNYTYRKYSGVPFKPKGNRLCNRCGICAKSCPLQAIPSNDPKQVDKSKCISCMRCISVCPTHSRKLNPLMLAAASQKLKKACSGRKENELFL